MKAGKLTMIATVITVLTDMIRLAIDMVDHSSWRIYPRDYGLRTASYVFTMIDHG